MDLFGQWLDVGLPLGPVGQGRALLWNNGLISLAVVIPLLFQHPLFPRGFNVSFWHHIPWDHYDHCRFCGRSGRRKEGFDLWTDHSRTRDRTIPRNHVGRIPKRYDRFVSDDPALLFDWFCPLHRSDLFNKKRRVRETPLTLPFKKMSIDSVMSVAYRHTITH